MEDCIRGARYLLHWEEWMKNVLSFVAEVPGDTPPYVR